MTANTSIVAHFFGSLSKVFHNNLKVYFILHFTNGGIAFVDLEITAIDCIMVTSSLIDVITWKLNNFNDF